MATVPTQITWVTGQVVTAAQLNSNVRDAVNFMLNPPSCAVRQTVTQSIPTGTTTPIVYDTEDRDNDGMHSASTNPSRLTAQTAGWYISHGGVSFLANATGPRYVFYRTNGTILQLASGGNQPLSTAAADSRVVGSTYMNFLNVGDYIECNGNQGSGGNLGTSVVSGDQSYFMVTWNGLL